VAFEPLKMRCKQVHKRDIVKCSAQLEFRKEFATVMAFDVPVCRSPLPSLPSRFYTNL
jgi:hypothetical protein